MERAIQLLAALCQAPAPVVDFWPLPNWPKYLPETELYLLDKNADKVQSSKLVIFDPNPYLISANQSPNIHKFLYALQ